MVLGWISARHLTGVEVSRYDNETNAFTNLLMWFVKKWDTVISSNDLKTESGWTIFSIKVIVFLLLLIMVHKLQLAFTSMRAAWV